MSWIQDVFEIVIALVLVALNGFFVAAEFAMVKVRGGQLILLGESGGIRGRAAHWLGTPWGQNTEPTSKLLENSEFARASRMNLGWRSVFG